MKAFQDKVVLITGGTRGIGRATARRFLEEGAAVVIVGRGRESLSAALASLDGKVEGCAADVATVEGCRTAVAAARQSFGRLDVLFACAGSYEAAPIGAATEALWDRTMDTHAKGTFFCVQEAAPALRENGGCVITMASDAGLLGFRGGWAAYCAAMGAVVNLTRQLAIDLAPDVRVNGLAPGPVGTEHLYGDLKGGVYGGFENSRDPIQAVADTLPLKRIIEPGEIADAVLFLAGARSMTGSILSIDAGSTIALP
ncbi:MAG TPA: SDR family oxidoreductase [Candidatus Limnocylindrales bacterium]|nr:SDR family oxidoreductase [Candidatus Limnocylindrales bacterium]